jgi:hypothetical protein
MVWIIALSAYCILATLLLVYMNFRDKGMLDNKEVDLERYVFSLSSVTEKAALIQAIASLKQAHTPWYERSVSTIGVVALISAALAAGHETIAANLQELKVKQLEVELANRSAERTAADEFLANLSKALIAGSLGTHKLSTSEKRLLRYRMDRILKSPVSDIGQIREVYALALALSDYEAAISVLEKNPDLLDKTMVGDRLTLAEYYFMVGSPRAALELQQLVWDKRGDLQPFLYKRLVVLRSALNLHSQAELNELARLLKLPRQETETLVVQEAALLQKWATGKPRIIEKN